MGSPDASRKWTIFVQNHGSLTEATPDRCAETVIIIEPTKPEELLPFSMTACGLSPREEELVKLVVRGLSTTRISRTLFISEHTVQNHLRSVFEKVGVRSRGELVKRLFFDNLYPTLST
jgi:DNA-binding CsgD family transcriptional regulator